MRDLGRSSIRDARSADSRYQDVMEMPATLAVLSLLGTAVFAASGALVAAEKRFDLIGAVFLSVAAGLGGGAIVDVLIGERVRWLDAPEPLWAALFSAVVVFELVRFGTPPEKTLVWADAAGLALFTATGTQRLVALGFDPAVTIFLTALGAAGGGIVRDVMANRAPLVFSGEIYVTAALLGALSYYALRLTGAADGWALAAALGVTFALRAAGIVFALRLPPGGMARRD
jgi:uncharacterized membrane protein YeiH